VFEGESPSLYKDNLTDSKAYWVGFNLVKGIGSVRLRILLQHFGDIETAWKASPQDLRAAGLGPKLVETFQQVRAEVSLERVWERIQRQDIQVLTWEDDTYPSRLKEIDQPPPVLYLRGNLLPEDEWTVAIVGTRGITAYGRQVTAELASVLARRGVTVVSGLARGVDAEAHKACLAAGGRTFAILGSVDQIYPQNTANWRAYHRWRRCIQRLRAWHTRDGINFPPPQPYYLWLIAGGDCGGSG
jgi:DNA processing protein